MGFSAQSIRSHVGSTSFERGRNYFTSGNVIAVSIDKDMTYGRVSGSKRTPYETTFTLKSGEIIDSRCSCPVGYACKHVAALGLASLLEFAKTASFTQKPTEASKLIKPKESSSWKQTLSKLLSVGRLQSDNRFQLQLLLKIEQQYSYSDKTNNFRLMIRPRIFDPKSGKFSVTEIKWADAEYRYGIYWEGRYGNMPKNQLIFLRLVAFGLNDRHPSGWEEVNEDKADYFWHILSQHQSYGVALLAGAKGQIPVTISTKLVETKIEITKTESGLEIGKQIVCDGQDITGTQIVFVGQPPAFAVYQRYNSYVLYSVASGQMSDTMLNTPLKIPQKDIPRLQKDYLNNLAHNFTVISHTDAVALPKVVEPKPLITLAPTKGRAIEIELSFIYNDMQLPFYDTPDKAIIKGQTILLNMQALERMRQTVEEKLSKFDVFGQDDDGGVFGVTYLFGIDAARFIAETLPLLRTEIPDLTIITSPDIPNFTHEESAPEVILKIDENEEAYDWFDLNVSVIVGKEQVPFQQLFQALVDGQKFLLLQSGKYFSLEREEFNKLRQLLNEAKSIQEKGIDGFRLSRFQAGLWDELAKTGIVATQAKRWQETMEGLLLAKGVKIQTPPKNLLAHLRPYQLEGYSWLTFLRQYKLGGVLADDMGLGKTIQAIALVMKAKSEKVSKKPFLVIAPTSVVENWDMELARFAPSLKKVIMRAGDRSKQFAKVGKADIVVISYALFVRDFKKLEALNFDTVILDEAQMVKNYQSKAYGIVRKLRSDCRIALTGTPLENNLMELWSIFSIVAPGLFPSPEKFREAYKTPIEKGQSREILDKLKKRIRPFLLRRQKTVVETQLPAKNEQILYLPLNDAHRHLYDLHLQHERKRVLGMLQNGGLKDHRFEIFRSLTRLRQLCLHPKLLDEKHDDVPSTKVEVLKEQLEQIIAERHRVLIFSQFTSFLVYIKAMLRETGYNYLYLAGETKNRGKLIQQFQKDSSISVFLISLKAGGFGLNLTAADYCILLDPWWNPAVEIQAVDRAHRIGQKKTVFVYKFIAKDTIEEKVLGLQEKKRKLFQNVLDEESLFSTMISEEDIKSVFAI